jgi:putative transport protein
MLVWLEQFLIRYPELALFLIIGAGYWIGSLRIGTFTLGPVTGALFAGLLLGQFAHVPVSGMTKSFLFLLFLFGIGYSVGPQFLPSLKRHGVKPILLVLLVCGTGLGASILVSKALGLDAGFAAGLMSGALTQSAAMGTATDAINGLAVPTTLREQLVSHVAVADAGLLHLRLCGGDHFSHHDRTSASQDRFEDGSAEAGEGAGNIAR